jgi:deoxyribodipyrimidine photo-lyase
MYAEKRNDPNLAALSNLSPWLHFGSIFDKKMFHCKIDVVILNCLLWTGQISAQRCILEVKGYKTKHAKSVDAYMEETIIRRELSDNFCFYNPNYDNLKGCDSTTTTKKNFNLFCYGY